jgi:predicted GNAT superfamily acetyltransferase
MATLRDLHDIDDYRKVVDLETEIWGYTDMVDVVTLPVFIITVKRGAILIGAFDDRDRMIGFVYSIVGMKNGRPMQWSHMAGVVPEYRNRGLGYQLKLAQRERAMAAGFELIEWTFDPLQAANAHLNFAKLGVVCDEYAVNIYGESSSALHRGTPTDRFVVQWNIREPHVERRIGADRTMRARSEEAARAPVVNRDRVDLSIDERRVWVEIPTGFTEMQQRTPDRALEWRMQTRAIFQTYFGRGLRAVDFELMKEEGRGRYLLARP